MKFITTKEFACLSPIDLRHKEHSPAPEKPGSLRHKHILFMKKLPLTDTSNCRLRITADDYYKLYINRKFVAMGPSPSYPQHRSFNEFDISEYLINGDNLITVHVYYQGLLNRAYDSADNRCALGFELYGNNTLICEADESWQYHYDTHFVAGDTIGYNTQFKENLDFRLYDSDVWNGKTDGSQCVSVDNDYVLNDEPTRLIAIEDIKPMHMCVLSEDEIFVDFGKEYVGYPVFKMSGKCGQTLTLLCGEETEADNKFLARGRMRCNCDYCETLTMSGGIDTVDFFEYKAFRYMTLVGEGVRSAVDLDSIKLLARHAEYKNGGAELTECEPLLRDIWELCEHTAHYATEEGFLDCPTREKGQYLGDFTVSGLAHLYLTGDPYMYRKTLLDFAKSAEICKGIMAVAPGSFMQEIADFSLQYPLQLLNYCRYTGDRETALALMPTVYGILEHFKQFEREDGLLVGVTDKWNLVDWPRGLRDGYDFKLSRPIASDALHNVINAFYIGAHKCAEELSDMLSLGHENRSEALSEAFNKTFYNEELNFYTDSPHTAHASLHSNVLPVFFGFEKEDCREKIVDLIEEKKFSCGVQFSYFVLGACARLSAYELEYSLITDKGEHSWYNMLKEGATTLFEAWGKDQKDNTSLCHPWASAPIIALCQDADNMRSLGINIKIDGFVK